jgi:hypothetical protein
MASLKVGSSEWTNRPSEAPITPGLPPLREMPVDRLRSISEEAINAYREAVSGMVSPAIPYIEDCSIAAPAVAGYLRRVFGLDANTCIGLYVRAHPRVRDIQGPEIAERVDGSVRKAAFGTAEKPRTLMGRSILGIRDESKTEWIDSMKNTHVFVTVKISKGNYLYVDPTYQQFENQKHSEYVIDVVDSKKLAEEYGIVLWSPADQTRERRRSRAIENREPTANPEHDAKAHEILQKMLQLKKN